MSCNNNVYVYVVGRTMIARFVGTKFALKAASNAKYEQRSHTIALTDYACQVSAVVWY